MNSKGSSVTVSVRVQPRASRNTLRAQPDGTLKIYVTAAPVDGAANSALLSLLAKTLGVPRGALKIVAGKTGRNKIVQITGIDGTILRARLFGLSSDH